MSWYQVCKYSRQSVDVSFEAPILAKEFNSPRLQTMRPKEMMEQISHRSTHYQNVKRKKNVACKLNDDISIPFRLNSSCRGSVHAVLRFFFISLPRCSCMIKIEECRTPLQILSQKSIVYGKHFREKWGIIYLNANTFYKNSYLQFDDVPVPSSLIPQALLFGW